MALKGRGLVAFDNMLWSGRIFDAADQSPDTTGIREVTRLLCNDPGWIATLLPIRDGLIMALKK